MPGLTMDLKGEDGESFDLNGFRFVLSTSNYERVTHGNQVVLLKPPLWLEYYQKLLKTEKIERVLELGVFQGGMALLLPSLSADLRYMGVEYQPGLPEVAAILSRRPDISDRVRIEFGTSQDDPGLPAMVTSHFGNSLDLVIDDASHMYGFSRRSFSQFFPLLRPGGIYIVEDWGWAHWPGYVPPPRWLKEPCLSNLLFEISMAAASSHGLIDRIEIQGAMFMVHRGKKSVPEGWTLDDALNINGQVYTPLVVPPSFSPAVPDATPPPRSSNEPSRLKRKVKRLKRLFLGRAN